MIAPFFFRNLNDNILITNDFGRFCFLKKTEFDHFMCENLSEDTQLYQKLKDGYFLYDSSVESYIDIVKNELRRGKSYVFSSTSLHIFVVTNYCNSKCVYCQAQSNCRNESKKMSKATAEKAVDVALQSPQKELDFEFQGGEPLSNFETIKHIVEYSKKKNTDKVIRYSVVTNLTLLTEEMLDFFLDNNISISTSLDGDMDLHNLNRPLIDEGDSYTLLVGSIDKIRSRGLSCGAIQTTTKASLSKSKEIVDEYLKTGFNNLFIRPLTPLGFALNKWENIGYSTKQFLSFYKECLDYIIEKNRNGQYMKEGHAAIFLSKILHGYGTNYMELRSPCGAGIGQLAYYYDGNVFTCDEARMLQEMGDSTFRLGNVFEDDYNSLIDSKVCAASCKYSILEGLPQCSDCAYMPYCGTCPVINYALENDVISRSVNNYRCDIYKGMLDIIFELLIDQEKEEILRRWI